jgi:hypothetical protein
VYPNLFQSLEKEIFRLNGVKVNIPKCLVRLEEWKGKPVKNTFGGKPIVKMDQRPMFAELAIKEHFVANGWEARWVETYGRVNKKPLCLSTWKDDKFRNQIGDPIKNEEVLEKLSEIAKYNNDSYSGCWDILAWKSDNMIFAELKRESKDRIRQTQIDWLFAGLKSGLKPENFLIVEWDMQ